MPHKPEDFVGAWSLEDWRVEYSDGGVTRPFGERPTGLLIYSAACMSATVSKTERKGFGLTNARHASDEQKAEAFDSYFHYAGNWHIDEDSVVHELSTSLNPDMAAEQRRLAVFDGAGGLTLSATESLADGGERRHVLYWRRKSPRTDRGIL